MASYHLPEGQKGRIIKSASSDLPRKGKSSLSSQEQAYELAYKLACEQLARINDVEEQCRKSGARYDAVSNKIIIDYLNQSYLITTPDGEISLRDSEEQVPLKDKILILHYFTLAKDTPATGILVTFKQLPGGTSYFSVFYQRAIKPILDHCGGQAPALQLLIDAAAKLGGYKADYGDVSVAINAFPRVSIIFVLWRGDDEFAPQGSILFDANISDYLSTEDVGVLCEIIAWKLVKNLRLLPPSIKGCA